MRQRQQYKRKKTTRGNCTEPQPYFLPELKFSFSGFSDMKVDRSSGCQACKSCINMLFNQQQQIHIISQMVSFNFTKIICELEKKAITLFVDILYLLVRYPCADFH